MFIIYHTIKLKPPGAITNHFDIDLWAKFQLPHILN